MIAWHLQEWAFGGLDQESLRFLDGLARRGSSPRRRQLKPGTVLVRDYQGQRYTVTVALDGFDWQGTTYPSLSAIARAITGTVWSGPRFFALARGNGTPSLRKNNRAPEESEALRPARGLNTHYPQIWRHRPWARDQQALLPDDGRRHHRRERAGQRLDVHHSAAENCGRF
jgi:Protein of unknown function (DUF2924)